MIGTTQIGRILPCGAIVDRISHRNNFNKIMFVCICTCGDEFVTRDLKRKNGCKKCYSKHCSISRCKDYSNFSWDNGTYIDSFIEIKNRTSWWKVYCSSCEEFFKDSAKHMIHPDFPKKCKLCTLKKEDITGYKFGKGCIVIGEDINKIKGPRDTNRYWFYQCRCGNISSTTKYHVENTIQECRPCSDVTTGINISGSKHYNYNHNLSDEDREPREYCLTNRWRRQILKRYNGQCIITGETNNLHVHHIYNYSEHKNLRTNVNNGVPLRSDLHIKFHQTYGYKNNDVHQLNEFILNN